MFELLYWSKLVLRICLDFFNTKLCSFEQNIFSGIWNWPGPSDDLDPLIVQLVVNYCWFSCFSFLTQRFVQSMYWSRTFSLAVLLLIWWRLENLS